MRFCLSSRAVCSPGIAFRRGLQYFSQGGWRGSVGTALVVYALAYPALTIASGHSYPATPTFGVPCPTTILTIGLFLTIAERVPVSMVLVPIVWGFIGGSASVPLAVPTDYVLLGAGVLLTVVCTAQRRRRATAIS